MDLPTAKKVIFDLITASEKQQEALLDRLTRMADADPAQRKSLTDEVVALLREKSRMARRLTYAVVLLVAVAVLVPVAVTVRSAFTADPRDLLEQAAENGDLRFVLRNHTDGLHADSSANDVHFHVHHGPLDLGVLDNFRSNETLALSLSRRDPLTWSASLPDSSLGLGFVQMNLALLSLAPKGDHDIPYKADSLIRFPESPLWLRYRGPFMALNDTTYSVELGERLSGDSVVTWWREPITVRKTPNGRWLSPPTTLWMPEWSSVYFVSLGMGLYEDGIHRVNAHAMQLEYPRRRR